MKNIGLIDDKDISRRAFMFRLRNKNKNHQAKLDISPGSHVKKYFLTIIQFGAYLI